MVPGDSGGSVHCTQVGARRLCALPDDGAGSGVLAVWVGNTWRLWTLWVSSGPGSSCVSLEVVSVHCVVTSAVTASHPDLVDPQVPHVFACLSEDALYSKC